MCPTCTQTLASSRPAGSRPRHRMDASTTLTTTRELPRGRTRVSRPCRRAYSSSSPAWRPCSTPVRKPCSVPPSRHQRHPVTTAIRPTTITTTTTTTAQTKIGQFKSKRSDCTTCS
uniref:(northern house mosquito) hypothetical protein n=1 Tax=Culex pipiens TaxID=7175 RepID=A0A8D8JF16_CULPI